MKLVSTKLIQSEDTLAQSLYDEQGVILLARGMKLTSSVIQKLQYRGITYVYIEGDIDDDQYYEPIISDQLRQKAVHTLNDTFRGIKQAGLLSNSYVLQTKETELKEVVDQILYEVEGNESSLTLLSDIMITNDFILQHSLNVAIYSIAIGKQLNYTSEQLKELCIGALLHDVGKIFIESEILNKPSNLDEAEFQIIKNHTKLGYDYLRSYPGFPKNVAQCAYQHHERLDGSGYPLGLYDKDIIPYAKIIAVADVFDAVTSNRVYRDALLPHEALEILYAGAVREFDITIIEAFKKSIAVYPEGLMVNLSDGSSGRVIRQNKHLCDRPIIRVSEVQGNILDNPYELNLGKVMNTLITEVIKNR